MRKVDRIISENNVASELRLIITEEYGIAFEVVEERKKLVKQIINSFQNANKITDNNGVSVISNSFTANIFSNNVTIKYICYNFKSREEAIDKTSNYPNIYNCGSNVSQDGKIITFRIGLVCGNPTSISISVVQHELSHLYEIIKRLPNNLLGKDEKLYNIVSDNFEKELTPQQEKLNTAIYVTFETEQIAFSNQLDQMLETDPNCEYRLTAPYNYLVTLREVLDDFEQYKHLAKNYGLTENSLLRRLNQGYSNYIRRIGRILYKAKSKLNKTTIR